MSNKIEIMDEVGSHNATLRHIIIVSLEAVIAYDHYINDKDDSS